VTNQKPSPIRPSWCVGHRTAWAARTEPLFALGLDGPICSACRKTRPTWTTRNNRWPYRTPVEAVTRTAPSPSVYRGRHSCVPQSVAPLNWRNVKKSEYRRLSYVWAPSRCPRNPPSLCWPTGNVDGVGVLGPSHRVMPCTSSPHVTGCRRSSGWCIPVYLRLVAPAHPSGDHVFQ
jgi:hypothetical protein